MFYGTAHLQKYDEYHLPERHSQYSTAGDEYLRAPGTYRSIEKHFETASTKSNYSTLNSLHGLLRVSGNLWGQSMAVGWEIGYGT